MRKCKKKFFPKSIFENEKKKIEKKIVRTQKMQRLKKRKRQN